MFSDVFIKGENIKSSWKKNRKQRENGSQTSSILTYEVDCQTVPAQDTACQTVPLTELLQGSKSVGDLKFDAATLKTFLATVEPMISKQLKKNTTYNAFEESLWNEGSGSSDTSILCEYQLEEKAVRSDKDQDEDKLEVTSLSWSSSGSSIAVAYGSMKHLAWGQTRSYLCVWNLSRPRLNLLKSDQKLEVESSIQAVAFHPANPALLAAGLFSGVVLVWDLSKDESVYSSETHEDPVTSVSWLEPESHKYLDLVSGSTDGKFLIWKQKISRKMQPLQMVKEFKIKATSVGRNSGARGTGAVGITCSTVAIRVTDGVETTVGDERILIAGCENGAIVKCSIGEDNHYEDPVVFAYKAHLGPVYSVDWSPFHRHIFLSCSTDQTCRFYHSLHVSPLREFSPGNNSEQYLFAARWSPARALTLFSAGVAGVLSAYDACEQSEMNTVASEGRTGKNCQINCLETNKKRMEYVATGNADGIVHIWQMGSKFTSPDMDGKQVLNNLAEQAMTGE